MNIFRVIMFCILMVVCVLSLLFMIVYTVLGHSKIVPHNPDEWREALVYGGSSFFISLSLIALWLRDAELKFRHGDSYEPGIRLLALNISRILFYLGIIGVIVGTYILDTNFSMNEKTMILGGNITLGSLAVMILFGSFVIFRGKKEMPVALSKSDVKKA